MNFKEVQLTGFKSFADKTSIKFSDGVTCIVGPNGCGKSNVADAVRWVLGEQSAKTLRGSNMQDVIFGGTESRRALSYCEVTLVFDNSTHMFDIEYEEVAMTRRLYRSGESEYLLNMQTCRLRDIVNLLHGVGIGKEGYSIIGQGKVEQIMNAKPEDRRAIFEEATGVMHFKTEKGEIERKLEVASDKLSIYLQRMDEKESQLRPLERQAETVKKHRELSEKLRYEEVNTYLKRCDSFAAETAKYRAKIESAEAELIDVGQKLEAADTAEQQDRERISALDEQLHSLNDKLRLFEVGMASKTGEAKVIGERINSQKQRLSEATDSLQSSLSRIKDIDAQVAGSAKKREEDEKKSRALESECDKLFRKVGEADARLTAFERISDEKRASEITSVENLADVRANVQSLSAKRDAASERQEEVRTAIQKANSRREEYARQLTECRSEKAVCVKFLDEKPERESELTEEISALELSKKRLSEEIVDCNTSIANLTNNLEMYRNLKNRFDGYRDSVRNLQIAAQRNPALGSKIKGALADIVRTDKRYEVAIETAFGGAMQNLVTATEEDARDLIQYLKSSGGGIVTFLPVSAIRARGNSREVSMALREQGAVDLAENLVVYDDYYSDIIRYLLGNTLICDNIQNATKIAKKYPRAFKIVTLDGDIVATSGAMTGGSHKRDSGALLAGERRIKECEDGIKRKQETVEKLKRSLESCERDLEETRKSYEEFRLKVQEQAAAFAALSQREEALTGLIADAERDANEYTALLARLESRVTDLANEMLSSEENADLLKRARDEAASEVTARQAEGDRLKAERDELSDRLHELRVERASLESARAADEENVRRLAEEKASLLKKMDEWRGTIASTEQLIQQLKQDEEKAALTEEEQHTVGVLRSRIRDAEEEKRQINVKQSALAEEKRGLLARQTTLSEKRNDCKMEISRAESTLENMKQRLDEAYSLTYETAQEYRDEEYDLSQSASHISSLKHAINALGTINFNAEADYAELSAQYEEMKTQKEDLEKGIADSRDVLQKLRDAMQKQFDDGFNEINANFTKIFKELFGGGRAEMQLDYTDCDDPLDAGIEIVACPPGKKLTKISLLSGGERAYTAIAILFAILKSRPMPFCILDEIEAALDEANVDRFARYLKNFSKDTQFIVITHRKPTMNQADTLFGVTMEEKGVSKIVSVKLSEVEARLGGDTVVS